MIFSNPTPEPKENNQNKWSNYYQDSMNKLYNAVMQQKAAEENQLKAEQNSQPGLLGQLTSFGNLFKKNNNLPGQLNNGNTPIAKPSTLDEVGQVMDINGYNTSPIPNPVLPAASEGLQSMMPNLLKATQIAYPNNPIMQQVALSQAILESGLNGKPSSLATNHNNYFGIKTNKYYPGTNGSVDIPTTEYIGGGPTSINQGFASNNSMNDSFAQHAALMNGSPRYYPVMQAKNPIEAYAALGKSGYATDPNYASKLMAIHKKYVSPYYTS